MKICFLDNTNFQYNSRDLYSSKLRGAESVLVNLTKALVKLNHKVTVINNCPKNETINNIRWININSGFKIENFDLCISNGDCQLFRYVESKNNILFSHSIQSIEKFIRKKQLFSFMKYKPKICFISEYHKIKRSKLLYLYGYINLKWSVDEIFLNSKISNKIDNNQAIFTSNKERNLDLLINIWKNYIFPQNNKFKLLVNSENDNERNFQIYKRNIGHQKKINRRFKKFKVVLNTWT